MPRDKQRQKILDSIKEKYPHVGNDLMIYIDQALKHYAMHKVMQQRIIMRNHINLRNIPNPKFTDQDDNLSDSR